MKYWLSRFGNKFTGESGISRLMEDLDRGLNQAGERELYMLGGGNPALIPEMEDIFRSSAGVLLERADSFERMIGIYDHPRGNGDFLERLATYLREDAGLGDVGPENLVLTNGSQNTFFYLLNMFSGPGPVGGSERKILLPLIPEYIGYSDIGLGPDIFDACLPNISTFSPGEGGQFGLCPEFKYTLDREQIHARMETGRIGAICVSRPTNPSGNMLLDAELDWLAEVAREWEVPLIIDGAYGLPFPGVSFVPATVEWRPGMILTLSLSKLGLPGARTGIVVCEQELAENIGRINSIINLSVGSLGPALMGQVMEGHSLGGLCREIIEPYYRGKSEITQRALSETLSPLADFGLDWSIHRSEGALFLWLWLRGLKLDTRELYGKLSQAGLFVVPGEYYFPGLESFDGDRQKFHRLGELVPRERLAEFEKHSRQCLRLSFGQSEDTLRRGIAVLGRVLIEVLEKQG